VGDYNDPYAFAELLRSDYGINDTGWNDAAYDALLDRAAVAADPVSRRALLEEAERHMLAAQPVIPLYFYATRRLIKPHVKGWQSNIMDHHYTKHLWIERKDERT
jgi:oligopeptide transport system substrate-binding protein